MPWLIIVAFIVTLGAGNWSFLHLVPYFLNVWGHTCPVVWHVGWGSLRWARGLHWVYSWSGHFDIFLRLPLVIKVIPAHRVSLFGLYLWGRRIPYIRILLFIVDHPLRVFGFNVYLMRRHLLSSQRIDSVLRGMIILLVLLIVHMIILRG